MSRAINTAIAGFGYSGKVFHAPFIAAAKERFKLSKVLERHSDTSKAIYPWVEVVKDLEAIIKDPEIELVIIATPNISHCAIAHQMLNAGKNIIIEKPFTLTYSEALSLIELAEKKNKVLSVFHNRRWDGDFKTVKAIVENNMLGEIVEFESHFDRFRNYFKENSWRETDEPGGGILYDLGPHLIDQALSLFGAPESLIADVRIQRSGGVADDSFEIILNYGRLKVTLKAGMLVKGKAPRFILHGTKGTYKKHGLDPQENALKQGTSPLSDNWGIESEEIWGTLDTSISGLNFLGKVETLPGNYMEYYNNVYDAIVNGAELQVKAREAAETIKIIELSFESAAKGRRVLLS